MKTVLIAEDEFDAAELLELILLEEGYSVRVAHNGRDAIALLNEHVPDLLLTDLMMPLVDGLEVILTIRAEPRLAHLPVLLMSAARPELGPDPLTKFIGKPFDLDNLVRLVQELLA